MRVYDPRIAKFLSLDPLQKKYPELTPYQFASNTPVWAIDIDGLESGVLSFDPGTNLSRAETADHIQRSVSNWWSTPVSSPYWKRVLRNDEDVLGFPRGTFSKNGDVITAALMIYARNAQHEPGRGNMGAPAKSTPHVDAEPAPQAPKSTVTRNTDAPQLKVANEEVSAAKTSSTNEAVNGGTPSTEKPSNSFFSAATLQKGTWRSGETYLGGEFNFVGAKSKMDREGIFLANYHPNGKTLELLDAAYYITGLSNKEGKAEMGTTGSYNLLKVLKENAKAEGFEKLRIKYKRTEESSSKNPGHEEDKTFDL